MPLATELAGLFRRELTRLLEELAAFPDEPTLWTTVEGVSNSAGNLALHLEGNLREYIGRQLGQISYVRNRELEFSATGIPIADVTSRLESVRDLVPQVLSGLSASALDELYPEQVLGVPLSTRQFLIHLLGHISYHLGQIDYLRRILTHGKAISFARL